MKKITLLLALATLMSMTMNAEVKTYGQMNKKADKVVVSSTPTSVKAIGPKYVTGTKADVPEGYAQVTLTAGNVWDDGTGYQMLLDEDAIAYGTIIPETGGLTTSGDASADVYAEFEYKIPENADGALTTTNIVLDASVTILIPAGVYDWCITNPTPSDRVWIASSNGPIPGRYDDFEFASGAAYEFVVSLGGSNDQVELIIDDPTAPVIPTDVTADAVSADGTTATIAWVPGANNASWNLRWRPWTDPALMNKLWDFPLDGYEAQLDEGFMVYDADGDGATWGLAYSSDAQDDVCFYSSSYDYNYGGALTPDNWLFTPAVGMGGTLKFDAWQRSASYPDKFMVYVAPAEYETIDEFVPVSEFIIPTGTTPESFEIDLSEYEGMGVIAFRHYDCNDQWSIYLDNIAVEIPGAVEPAEWTLCENVENPYTIEGLMPDTKYEAQVMAIGPDGRTTDWTESVLFTTEVGAEPETGFFLVGTFNEWELTEEGGRIEFDNENRAEVRLQAGDEFKVITPAEDGGWLWFGGIDDNNVGYFLITPELLSHNLTLVDGANFRVEEGGLYHVNLVWNRDMPNYIVVTLAEPNAISTVGVDKTDNVYYNLLGVKFNGMPTTPGIYINNGKKVVIK
ncbi:MAG: DUF2436 domain-containing protein [Muribaculaceae bacterium]|nr:DUF2436 domain-containing protein [Muribaculaceae bacterium]